MSKRKKPVILGPDGRPYVAPPKPEPKSRTTLSVTNAEGGQTVISDEVHTFTFDASRYLLGGSIGSLFASPERVKGEAKKPLAEAVADQVGELAADFDGVGGAEMPRPTPDLHTYADAYTSAVKNCKHPNPESTMYARGEWFCPDCQRYFGPEEYKRTRDGGLFGRWFS